MNPNLRKRLNDVESVLSQPDVCFVPWTVYSTCFSPKDGETWEELKDRASRWLKGEDVPGSWNVKGSAKDPRTRQVVLFSFGNPLINGGDLLTDTISIGDTDSSGVRYEEIASKRVDQLLDQRIKEWRDEQSS